MSTEPRQSGDLAASEKPASPIRHQHDPSKAKDDDDAAEEAASQQQQ